MRRAFALNWTRMSADTMGCVRDVGRSEDRASASILLRRWGAVQRCCGELVCCV